MLVRWWGVMHGVHALRVVSGAGVLERHGTGGLLLRLLLLISELVRGACMERRGFGGSRA